MIVVINLLIYEWIPQVHMDEALKLNPFNESISIVNSSSYSTLNFGLSNTLMVSTTHCVKVSGVIVVRIFPHSEWIRRDTEYLFQMWGNTDHSTSEHGHFICSVSVYNNVVDRFNLGQQNATIFECHKK